MLNLFGHIFSEPQNCVFAAVFIDHIFVVHVYELITCVRRANENAGNVISVVQFLIKIYILPREFVILVNRQWKVIATRMAF